MKIMGKNYLKAHKILIVITAIKRNMHVKRPKKLKVRRDI